jgi:putative SOS response-associated peptidase YedK
MQAKPFESDAPDGARRAIVRRDPADGKPELIELVWGLASAQAGEPPFRFVRSEDRTFPSHRCLIPASEFHVRAGRRRYRFYREDGNWFYLAGIWRPRTQDHPEAFAVLTVPANAEVARYQERQGAMIPRNQNMQWLDLTRPESDLLVTPPARTFLVEEIGRDADRQPMLAL